MTLPSDPGLVRAECSFGVQRLLPLLDAFSKEIEGVESGQDIEYIHRMRVASRRLRAALPLFFSCIPEKKYRVWMLEIQKITRALGEARDTDVQIAFITKIIKKRGRAVEQKNPSTDYPVQGKRRCGIDPPLAIAKKTLKTPGCSNQRPGKTKNQRYH